MFSLYFLIASSQSRNQEETQGESKRGRGEDQVSQPLCTLILDLKTG